MSKKFPIVLAIGDTHDEPGVDQDRFTFLGELAVARQVDDIVFIGDFGDIESLLSHDPIAAKKSDLKAELESMQAAFAKFMRPIQVYNERMQRNKKGKYLPKIYVFLGNHEYRLMKLKKEQPQLGSFIPEDFLKINRYKQYDIQYIPYKGAHPGQKKIRGIVFAHFFVAGSMGKPAGGTTFPGKTIAGVKKVPCVAGHNHLRSWFEQRDEFHILSGLTLGKYFEQNMGYAGQSNATWWAGVCLLHITNEQLGDYDLECISLDRLKEMYLK